MLHPLGAPSPATSARTRPICPSTARIGVRKRNGRRAVGHCLQVHVKCLALKVWSPVVDQTSKIKYLSVPSAPNRRRSRRRYGHQANCSALHAGKQPLPSRPALTSTCGCTNWTGDKACSAVQCRASCRVHAKCPLARSPYHPRRHTNLYSRRLSCLGRSSPTCIILD